ncbi:YfjI family protein [Paracoccus sp. (in: a-proteobacteria)]|uniref:YfjI family protein n=1 Tax=Paracoccus sp. TaxID=267 RepID=UPI00289C8471|nr:YfjI family protein [Paracoccus sp. (in: a-proteobacteria)]
MTAPAFHPDMPQPIPFKTEGPQPLMREIPQGEPYPVHALGPLRAVVEAVEDISQAPAAIAAQSALSIAALAVQGFADVEILGGGSAPCSLFCLTIAESGERKSSCDRLLMNGIREHEAREAADYRDAFAEYEVAAEIWRGKRKRLMEAAAGIDPMKAAKAEADLKAIGAGPAEPLKPNLTFQEPTIEGLFKFYQAGRPSVGLFTDEGGSFIGGHGMNADNRLKTIAGYSSLWNGDKLTRMRAGDGTSDYPGRRLSMHVMVQPIIAHPFLADPLASGQGFLARFLITEPPSAIGTRLRRGHDSGSDLNLGAFTQRLGEILARPMPAGSTEREVAPVRLPLSTGAKELLWQFYERVERAQALGGQMEHVRSYASKAAEQAARIAGVLTLWTDLDAPEVGPVAMTWGIDLAGFYLGEARRLAEAGAVSEETARAELLRRWLVDSWSFEEVTPREVTQYGPNSLRESKVAKATIGVLVKHGWLVPLPGGELIRGANRKEAYRIARASYDA